MLGLHIRNVSRGGIGAFSSEPLDRTESVLLFFPPLGARPGRDVEGQVVRCTRRDDRFDVGIVFDRPWPERDERVPLATDTWQTPPPQMGADF